MTALEKLQVIYDKYAPRYDLLTGKLVELQQQIRNDENELKEAEKEYDVERIGKLTSKIANSETVAAKIREDIKEYKDSINLRPHYPNSIDKEISEVMNDAAHEENAKVQDKFQEIQTLHEKIQEIESELIAERLRVMEEYRVMLDKFRHLIHEPRSSTVRGWDRKINFYPSREK